MVIEIIDESFETETIKCNTPVVDFWAPWYGLCRLIYRANSNSYQVKTSKDKVIYTGGI